MTASSQLQDLHHIVADLIAIPTFSSFSRALSVTDEYIEKAAAHPDPSAPEVKELVAVSETYRTYILDSIRRLTAAESTYEHKSYDRKRSSTDAKSATVPKKRRGVIFNVDKGEHIANALQALQLENFLKGQDGESKKVHFDS
ncbi:hypothetical protein F5Y10DRAFT_260328 [Nemania abortiva]|nr:hypothetical protein F5Y10DRAFT_260328 [Nemania abortiva]